MNDIFSNHEYFYHVYIDADIFFSGNANASEEPAMEICLGKIYLFLSFDTVISVAKFLLLQEI